MVRTIEVIETEKGFEFDGKIVGFNKLKSDAKISVPFKEVLKRKLLGKKLKITIEIIED